MQLTYKHVLVYLLTGFITLDRANADDSTERMKQAVVEHFRSCGSNNEALPVTALSSASPEATFHDYDLDLDSTADGLRGVLHAHLEPFLGSFSTNLTYAWKGCGEQRIFLFSSNIAETDDGYLVDDEILLETKLDQTDKQSVRGVLAQQLELFRTLALPQRYRPLWTLPSEVPVQLQVFGQTTEHVEYVGANRFLSCLRSFVEGNLVFASPTQTRVEQNMLFSEYAVIAVDDVSNRHHLLMISEEHTRHAESWSMTKLTADIYPSIRTDNIKTLTGQYRESMRTKLSAGK